LELQDSYIHDYYQYLHQGLKHSVAQHEFWESCYDEVDGTLVPPEVTHGALQVRRICHKWLKELTKLLMKASIVEALIDACNQALADY